MRPQQVSATISLLDDGATVPFIARYRKEATGGLDEEQIRALLAGVTQLRGLDERRETVLKSIEEQGQLTPELRAQIDAAETLTALEDLYQPYRPKRRTRASIAREKGLEGLAEMIAEQVRIGNQSAEDLARQFLNADVPDVEAALAGARDIVAEMISDHPDVRGQVRQKALKYGLVQAQKVKDAVDEKGVYQSYYEFEFRVDRIKPYQVLALNRGEAEDVLRVHLDVAERDWQTAVEMIFRYNPRSPLADQLRLAIDDAAKRLLLPAIERDVRNILTEQAQSHAITVFAENLRGLLNQPPLIERTVIGIDPGFRTGCKVAVVSPTGKVLDTATIYPHEPQRQWQQARRIIEALVIKHDATLIAIGNGTASRETEQLAAELTRERRDVQYMIVNEAGASVYSASPLAKAELPDLDVTLRGAVSIARRAQDPLAELVKIDPQSIGVGMYQHDVDQKQLGSALDGVVETVVNRVGVDVNTASPALLTHVAGIGPKLAERIVAHRDENGPFKERKSLRKVQGLGPKAFEQAAGFLRIRDGANPLDASAIHPESYGVAEAVLKRAGITAKTSAADRATALIKLQAAQPIAQLAAELGTGAPTLSDIFEQLLRPGRDPREDLPAPILRSDVLSLDDLKKGLQLSGTVRNVVDFGAFVDIGVKQDGLLHRSQIPRGQSLGVGDVITVEILAVEKERGRISLGWVG
ncbi:MAG: RNA-binding transcriptional accessory protein [Anaerolineae bacterium]|nr:RNA-binding transcriptional accessory protein [Anaerolineae bacterium]